MAYNTRIIHKLFDDTNEVVLLEGYAARTDYLSKLIITNTDTASISPKVRFYNTNKSGEDDEYIQLTPEITLGVGERYVYESPVFFGANQQLVAELGSAVTTSQPQIMMVITYV
jgi:hypothetical protein|tara:strand:+ start:2210 stop:2551 length:342 start_codon:yes stop_codon:yes gene_type:complete